MYVVPAYGPNWQFKVHKMSKFLWHLQGVHSEFNWRNYRIAPWNRRRKPRRVRS